MIRYSNILRGTVSRFRCVTSSSSSSHSTNIVLENDIGKRSSSNLIFLNKSNPSSSDTKSESGLVYRSLPAFQNIVTINSLGRKNNSLISTNRVCSRMLSTNDLESATCSNEKLNELDTLEKKANTIQEWKEVIIGYAELGDPEKAEEIILHQQSIALKSDVNLLPDFDSYTSVLDSWGIYQSDLLKCQEREDYDHIDDDNVSKGLLKAAERADSFLQNMEDTFANIYWNDNNQKLEFDPTKNSDRNVNGIRPTSHHHDAVINAWHMSYVYRSKQGKYLHRGVPQRAQLRLEAMENKALTNNSTDDNMRPSIETYNHVMETWGVSDEYHFATMAQNIFDMLASHDIQNEQNSSDIKPNAQTYRIMLRTWCRSTQKGSAFNAMGVLMKMQTLLEEGVEEMEPSIEDYLLLLEAWSRADDKFAARRAQAILRKMDSLNKEEFTEVRPNTECFKYVFVAMANSNLADMGLLADNLMKQMVNDFFLLPDADCFSAIIETWSHNARVCETSAAQKEAASKAEEWLVKMERMYHQSSSIIIRAKTENYNSVIRAWSVCSNVNNATKNAENWLDKMEENAGRGDLLLKPDRDSYLYTINAWGNSHKKEQAQKSVDLLERMLKQYQLGNESCAPTADCYIAVLEACGKCKVGNNEEGRSTALRLAIETIHKMKNSSPTCEITSVTYKMLLQAIGNLLLHGKDKTKALVSVFDSCCAAGLVDEEVVKQFQEVAPDEVYHKTVLLRSKSGRTLPEDWTRNLGNRARSQDGLRSPLVSVDGSILTMPGFSEYKMRKLRLKSNQKLLRGGRNY